MPPFVDITGQRYGRWVAISWTRVNKRTFWLCQCDCGVIRDVEQSTIRRGTSVSCGCLQREVASATFLRHGRTRNGDKLYRCWMNMKRRCRSDPHYTSRAIRVCPSWRLSFEAFAADMGEPPSDKHSIDRIDNDDDYRPGNCRWATHTEQMRNTRKAPFYKERREMPHWRVFVDSEVLRYCDFDGRGDVTFTIKSVTKGRVVGKGGKASGKAMLAFEEAERPLGAGTAVLSVIAQLYGNDTRKWVGKKVTLYGDPNVVFGGEKVGGVRVRAVVPKTEAPAPSEQKAGAQ